MSAGTDEEAIFRSADMILVQFYFANEVAREVTFKLGDEGNVHFIDLNKEINSFQRVFVSDVRRVDTINQHLRYLHEQAQEHADFKLSNYLIQKSTPTATEIEMLSQEIINRRNRVKELDDSLKELQIRKGHLAERREILIKSQEFFNDRSIQDQATRLSLDATVNAPLLVEQDMLEAGTGFGTNIELSNLNDIALNYIVGSIETTKAQTLHILLFRQLRGNVIFTTVPLNEPLVQFNKHGEEETVSKSAFICYTYGSTLLSKAKKTITSLDGNIIDIAADLDAYSQDIKRLNDRISDIEHVMRSTEETLNSELYLVAEQLDEWRVIFRREQELYHTLNKFKKSEHMNQLIAEGWIPASDFNDIKLKLREAESTSAVVVQQIITNKVGPTFHKTNKFTQAFQSIVDAYGIATYQEVNPGLATVVTFPFMFAIMFGDLGHGLILFLIALYLVLNETKLARVKKDEISAMAYDGRYILLLMGIFSMYTGLLYNDVFSKSMTLFKSGWKWPEEYEIGQTIEAERVGTYFFGLDFAWHGTENNLIFTNSYKMKLSILMGYVHMSYSFMFSLVNYRFKHSKIDVGGNFLPGLIFMQSIFGYLSFTILYKWANDWSTSPAPGLLNMLINMFLSPGKIDDALFPGQALLQVILLLAAVSCVPVLLLYKPLQLKKLNDQAIQEGYKSLKHKEFVKTVEDFENRPELDRVMISQFEEPGDFEFGDVMIHQVIHTIEFCLNCVSHTASYLRLWALSLAHAQLSTVLWSMTIANAFSSDNPGSFAQIAKVIILFGLWFVLTVCILVLMEGTSAMLHSLRLHWVEAMSKFFEGEGYAYAPFKLTGTEDDLDDD